MKLGNTQNFSASFFLIYTQLLTHLILNDLDLGTMFWV